jgi:hypothetical protein
MTLIFKLKFLTCSPIPPRRALALVGPRRHLLWVACAGRVPVKVWTPLRSQVARQLQLWNLFNNRRSLRPSLPLLTLLRSPHQGGCILILHLRPANFHVKIRHQLSLLLLPPLPPLPPPLPPPLLPLPHCHRSPSLRSWRFSFSPRVVGTHR